MYVYVYIFTHNYILFIMHHVNWITNPDSTIMGNLPCINLYVHDKFITSSPNASVYVRLANTTEVLVPTLSSFAHGFEAKRRMLSRINEPAELTQFWVYCTARTDGIE